MTQRLIKILLSELAVVRFVCKNQRCGAVVEIPVDSLEKLLRDCSCPVCREFYLGDKLKPEDDLVAALGRVLRGLKAKSQSVEVEFVVPEE